MSLQGSRGVRGQRGPPGVAGLPGPQVRTLSCPSFPLALAVANRASNCPLCCRVDQDQLGAREPPDAAAPSDPRFVVWTLLPVLVDPRRSRPPLCSGSTWRSWRAGRARTSGTARTAGRYFKTRCYRCGAKAANANPGGFQGLDGRDGYGPGGTAGVKVSPRSGAHLLGSSSRC